MMILLQNYRKLLDKKLVDIVIYFLCVYKMQVVKLGGREQLSPVYLILTQSFSCQMQSVWVSTVSE